MTVVPLIALASGSDISQIVYMEQPFEQLLSGCRADLQVIPTSISAGSVGIVTRAGEETHMAQLKELLAVDICCKTGHQKV